MGLSITYVADTLQLRDGDYASAAYVTTMGFVHEMDFDQKKLSECEINRGIALAHLRDVHIKKVKRV